MPTIEVTYGRTYGKSESTIKLDPDELFKVSIEYNYDDVRVHVAFDSSKTDKKPLDLYFPSRGRIYADENSKSRGPLVSKVNVFTDGTTKEITDPHDLYVTMRGWIGAVTKVTKKTKEDHGQHLYPGVSVP